MNAKSTIKKSLNWVITQYDHVPPRIRLLGWTMTVVVITSVISIYGITILFYILAAVLGGVIRLIWNYPITLLILPALIAGILVLRDTPAENPQTKQFEVNEDNDIF
jgi:hypothetical protein